MYVSLFILKLLNIGKFWEILHASTPLNTVCMGLTLMHEEIASALGYTPITMDQHRKRVPPSSTALDKDAATGWFKQVNQLLKILPLKYRNHS